MKDGMRIAYVSYRPKASCYPTVFEYTPYSSSIRPFDLAKHFLDAGYAFVGANFPGTGCSEGLIDTWYDRKVGESGAEVVEWIAKQPWSDGNVGMVGNSFGGVSQFKVAAERPPHLRAITPGGIGDGYEDMTYVGGMMMLGMMDWAITTELVEGPNGAQQRIILGDTECSAIRGSKRQVVKHSFFEEMRRHPLKDEWWESVSVACKDVAGRVNVPTLMMAASQDEWGAAARQSARIFTQLMRDVPHKRLVMANGDHSATTLNGYNSYSIIDAERMKWLDRWVKGVKNGIENEPPVTVYWEVQMAGGDPKKSVAGWVTHHNTWPEPAVERRPFYLTADAKISPDMPCGSPNAGFRAYLYPTGVELLGYGDIHGDSQKFQVRPHQTGVLNYRMAPATSDIVLLGNPEVTLYVSIDNGDDADFELTLKDIDPEGNQLFLQSGLLRASLRAIDKERTYEDEVVHLFTQSEKLVPGEIYEIRMSLLSPIAHVVRRGHSLELTIGAPNPIPHREAASIPAGDVSVNKVYHSEKYTSRILLPIIPSAKAQAPAPECGTLQGQPFRKGMRFVHGGLPIPWPSM
ncbi:CocE/NonD family hydrolase [Mesorhizobium ciceri]|uniref:CocE/NonD family hydrolase n=1 Tax=Mesorhizobium TaxID=68287 RepID=UPI001FCD3AE2|nr:CocE/NonD family hydrolase [Mesorhizobium ciceri]